MDLFAGLYDAFLAFLLAVSALCAICLVMELSFIAYDRLCFWMQERERRR